MGGTLKLLSQNSSPSKTRLYKIRTLAVSGHWAQKVLLDLQVEVAP
jgi:hypothetical protein